ncbi:MAG: DUF1566 domain-containing protein [Candidatus Eisenbacteria bacterium]
MPAPYERLTALSLLVLSLGFVREATGATYEIVDTGQTTFYGETVPITPPADGQAFFGQDAQYAGNAPAYTVSADALTAYDEVTGLTWQRSPDTDLDGTLETSDKLSFWDALEYPAGLNAIAFGGFDDWRLPTIKELYSLILFSGLDPSGWNGGTEDLVPFLDTDVFEFIYGDESVGERIIDSQYWSSTEYVSTTMNEDHTVFGVNFADGRIKGYGTTIGGSDKTAFVLCVRGNSSYGINGFVDNGDGTITDSATGLMWMQEDNGAGVTWEDALSYSESLSFAGHDDWRLPNAKELQSIVDYTRSPATHGTAAIDPLFTCSTITDEGGRSDFPFYWTGTTHANWTIQPGSAAAYVAFGTGLGWMQTPFPPFDYNLLDVHGAGCQRSDPKVGDPGDYPYGHGPQGDVIRIYNYVRCVRDAADPAGTGDPIDTGDAGASGTPRLQLRATPNPSRDVSTVQLTLPDNTDVSVTVHDTSGRLLQTLASGSLSAGVHALTWNGRTSRGGEATPGVYFVRVVASGEATMTKLLRTE